jgi:hypothetical protein
VGCGTGENALHLASQGLTVLGVDVAETARAGEGRRAREIGGTVFAVRFSDAGPDPGPHPVSQAELRAAFAPGTGWTVASIAADRLATRFQDGGAPAWLATITRT